MVQNLADSGALLVHPTKAFVLRHLTLPNRYASDGWTTYSSYFSRSKGDTMGEIPDPEVRDYILRLHASAETLFGPVEFALHCNRSYTGDGLPFHRDDEDAEGRELVRMVTCVHNATDIDRHLTFARPTWTNHTESFDLPIPAKAILAFSGPLITDYEHGVHDQPDTRSVITRFALWKDA